MVKGSKHSPETRAKLSAAGALRRRDLVRPHGTNDRYVNESCRCEHCAKARSAYMAYRRIEAEAKAAAPAAEDAAT